MRLPGVRPAVSADMAGVEKLLGELNRQDDRAEPVRFEQTFNRILEQKGLTLFVAQEEAELAGTLYLNIIPNLSRQCSPYALVENVVVSEHRRGLGIGKALMQHAVDVAFNAGCYKIMLLTGRDVSTHKFYRRCGFSSDAKTAFVLRDGFHQQEQGS